MATSEHQLPPEMVEAIDTALRASGHQHRTHVVVDALTPLLAERDGERFEAGRDEGLAYDKRAWSQRLRDLERAEAEARRLREALERASQDLDAAAIWLSPTDQRHRQRVHVHDRARAARAALSASPDPEGERTLRIDVRPEDAPGLLSMLNSALHHGAEPELYERYYSPLNEAWERRCAADDAADAAPVSVPEQEEGRGLDALAGEWGSVPALLEATSNWTAAVAALLNDTSKEAGR